MTDPWVPDEVINRICGDLTQDAAKVRYLKKLNLTVTQAHNGKPLVLQSNLDAVYGGMPNAPAALKDIAAPSMAPNISGMVLQFVRGGA